MSIGWYFNEARPGDRARESKVENFFNSDVVANRANAIVREGIQNSLDAAASNQQVLVRIAIGSWPETERRQRLQRYTNGFFEHFDVEVVRSRIPNAPRPTEEFRYLLFEDFGTSGLLGNPTQWWPHEHGQSNPFFNYFRGEGISDKTEGARGRHGVGRLVFMFASRIRSIFALTRRTDGRELLMGTAVLRNHWYERRPYLPDGWFGVPNEDGLTLPVEHDHIFLSQFKSDFAVSRVNESGLSVVVPWLTEDVNAGEITQAVIEGYFYPILSKTLVVEVANDRGECARIGADNIKSIIDAQDPGFAARMRPVIALAEASLPIKDPLTLARPANGNAPKWSIACLPDELRLSVNSNLEAGQVAALRVPMQTRPKGQEPADCHFDIFLQRDTTADERQIIFIREGIIVSDVRPRRTSGVRALVIVEEGPLATFLGDAENPSHTQWQKELVRDKYSYWRATIDYVVDSVPSILSLLSEDQKKPETSLLLDLFSLLSDEQTPKVKKEPHRTKPGKEPEPPPSPPPPKPKPFLISQVKDGFQVSRGNLEAERPHLLAIRVAYGVRRGSPFARYDTADFQLGKDGIKTTVSGGELIKCQDNSMVVLIINDDFDIRVTGFDTKRDLHIDARATGKEAMDAATA